MSNFRGSPWAPVDAQVDMMKSHVVRPASRDPKSEGERTMTLAVPAGWTREAKCVGSFDLFDISVGLAAGEAAARCAGCPVIEQCLTAALAEENGLSHYGRYGVRGGLSPKERAKLGVIGVEEDEEAVA